MPFVRRLLRLHRIGSFLRFLSVAYRQLPGLGRRGSGRPPAAPVGSPFSMATTPLTITVRMPVEKRAGWT